MQYVLREKACLVLIVTAMPLEPPLAQGPFFTVDRSDVEFTDIEKDVKLTQTVAVYNTHHKTIKIRVEGPRTAAFTVDYDPVVAGYLAPGLCLKLQINFFTRLDVSEFSDHLIIKCSEPQPPVKLNLSASKSIADMLVSADVLSYAVVPVGKSVSRALMVTNRGTVPGTFTTTVVPSEINTAGDEALPVRIEVMPASGTVAPGQSIRVEVNIESSKEFTSFCESVKFNWQGVSVSKAQAETVLLNGSFVRQQLVLLLNGVSPDSLSFGPVYYGHRKTIRCKLVNSGCLPLQYIATSTPSVVVRGMDCSDRAPLEEIAAKEAKKQAENDDAKAVLGSMVPTVSVSQQVALD